MDDYKFTVMWKEDVMADVELYDKRRKVRIEKYKNTFPENPFYGGEVTPERVYRFLEGRCMDRNRPCLPEYLKWLGLEEYNPYEIVKITHGTMWHGKQGLCGETPFYSGFKRMDSGIIGEPGKCCALLYTL